VTVGFEYRLYSPDSRAPVARRAVSSSPPVCQTVEVDSPGASDPDPSRPDVMAVVSGRCVTAQG
jgi:hypothetical protein